MTETPPLLFEAELRPHRSLGPRGFFLLMAGVCVVSFVAGLVFFVIGAWPVVGFFGLDVLLIYAAFRLSYRAGRLVERLELSGEALTVRRIEPSGRAREWQFQPYWLKLELDGHTGARSRLVLASHGRRLEIGAFLASDEREDLADTLRAALTQAGAA